MQQVDSPEAIARAGVAALQRGDGQAARRAFEQIAAAGAARPQTWLLLAQACAMTRDAAAEHQALDRVLAADADNLYALMMKGDALTATGDDRAAVVWYQRALRRAPSAESLPADLIEALRRAEAATRRAAGQFQAHLEAQLAAGGVDRARVGARFQESLDILAGGKTVYFQEPTSFFYPRLPQIQFYDPADFPWVAGLEATAPAMLAELDAVLADDSGLQPYLEAEPNRPAKQHSLLGDPSWSAYYLWKGGELIADHAARCPRTLAALADAPIPRISGRSPMALFSVLKRGTHIPPHNGMLNTRLICHIPLIVPPACRLRVGNETRAVEAGKAMLFDDSIEHEAWNDSDQTRVVLLFEVWRPELSEAERAALTTLFEAIGEYQGNAGEAE